MKLEGFKGASINMIPYQKAGIKTIVFSNIIINQNPDLKNKVNHFWKLTVPFQITMRLPAFSYNYLVACFTSVAPINST